MTNQELVDLAAIELGLIEAGNSLTAAESADSMAVLNQMMAAWAVSDKNLQFFPQNTLSDTVPIPIWAEEGVISNLALKMAVPFRVTWTQELAAKAMAGSQTIARTLINGKLEPADLSHLPQGAFRQHNILTDT